MTYGPPHMQSIVFSPRVKNVASPRLVRVLGCEARLAQNDDEPFNKELTDEKQLRDLREKGLL